MSDKVKSIFDHIIDVIFSNFIVLFVISIGICTVWLILSELDFLKYVGVTGHYIDIIADVLTLYVLIELSRSLVELWYSLP